MFIVIIWAIVLLFFTCVANFSNIFYFDIPQFKLDPHPDLLQLFNFSDFNLIHHHFVIVKLGHFFGFAIFDFLVFLWSGNRKLAITMTISFAILTEFLQIISFRDGRIYDMMIDSAGAFMTYAVIRFKKP